MARQSPPPPPHDHPRQLTGVIDRNIAALLARREQEERSRPREQRIADAITRFTGSMKFVYIHLILYGMWIIINLGWTPFLPIPRFDPTFVALAMVASVEAIFLATFVLISQNRMMAQSDRRADLDLQVSLLTEYELTRLISLVSEMARREGVEQATSDEMAGLAEDMQPERVLDRMDAHKGAVERHKPRKSA